MLVMIVGCLGWIDQHDMLYWSKMKEGFIAMDYLLLATVLCLFVLPKERISVYSVLLCDLMMLIVIFYYLLNKMDDHSLITKINIKKLRKLPDN